MRALAGPTCASQHQTATYLCSTHAHSNWLCREERYTSIPPLGQRRPGRLAGAWQQTTNRLGRGKTSKPGSRQYVQLQGRTPSKAVDTRHPGAELSSSPPAGTHTRGGQRPEGRGGAGGTSVVQPASPSPLEAPSTLWTADAPGPPHRTHQPAQHAPSAAPVSMASSAV